MAPKGSTPAALSVRRTSARLAGAMTVGLGVLVVAATLAPVSDFTRSHYLFTYQDGFFRRALIGSVVAAIDPGPVAPSLPATLGFAYLLLLIVLVGVLVARAWTQGDRTATFLLAALLIGASQLRILAFDIGKFDGLLLALTAATAVATARPGRPPRLLVGVLAVTGVLVHELHLVAGIPLAAAMVARSGHGPAPGRIRAGLLVIAPAAVLGAAIALFAGAVPGGSVAAADARMSARAGFALNESAAFVQDLGVIDSIRATFNVFTARPGPMLLSLLVAVPPTLSAILLLRVDRREREDLLLVAAALSPVLLLPLGFDWYRWVTVAVVNLIIVGLWRQATGTTTVNDPASSPPSPGLAAPFLVLVSVVLASISLSDVIANVSSLLVPG